MGWQGQGAYHKRSLRWSRVAAEKNKMVSIPPRVVWRSGERVKEAKGSCAGWGHAAAKARGATFYFSLIWS